MARKRWARVRKAGAHGLRRGAWYTVVNDKRPTIVFLDINKRNVAIDRTMLEFSDVAPYLWSVVVRSGEETHSKRASDANLMPTYGVCPNCRNRANLTPGAERETCPNCRNEYVVDWDHPC